MTSFAIRLERPGPFLAFGEPIHHAASLDEAYGWLADRFVVLSFERDGENAADALVRERSSTRLVEATTQVTIERS